MCQNCAKCLCMQYFKNVPYDTINYVYYSYFVQEESEPMKIKWDAQGMSYKWKCQYKTVNPIDKV